MSREVSKPHTGMVIRGSDISATLFAFGIFLVAILLARTSWWGLLFQTAYIGMLVAVYWMALSSPAYRDEMKRQESNSSRRSYVFMNLLFFAPGPTLVWLLIGLPLLILNLKAHRWIH